MKNIKLGIFVVGTTVMLWLGCGNYTWDPPARAEADYSALNNHTAQKDSFPGGSSGTIDELDE